MSARRYMDEIFIAISGPYELAIEVRDMILVFLENSLDLKVNCSKARVRNTAFEGVQFLGMDIGTVPLSELQSSKKETPLRVVNKLTSKIRLFSEQKQWHWEAWTKRLGKKWLAHALKKIKESDDGKHGMTDDLREYRKPGMKPDHWFKEMLIIWIQDLDKQFETDKWKKSWLRKASEEDLLSEIIT